MQNGTIKSALVFILIFSFAFTQFIPCIADSRNNKLHVAFVGIKFKNVSKDIQDDLISRLNAILKSKDIIELTKPEGALATFGRNQITSLVENQDLESFIKFAEQHKFDHVFSGYLANQSIGNNQIKLVGELDRYDLSNGQVNRFKINKSYEKIDNDFKQFKNQYVASLAKVEDSGNRLWTILLVGGIVTAGILTFRVALGSAGGTADPDVDPSDH